ncbi:hypothetical protein T03_13467 [Trichinella britovi]|uniref:Uncharacterized protein n=1 Tax=Trichinella britovi TaxID=45882 RepID=A0A0V0Z0N5_TRIBR|nr:hypothetical protein T03_13467 [Trichinella britovi]
MCSYNGRIHDVLMSSSKGIDIWLEISEFQAQVSTHFQVQSVPLL